MSGTASGFNFGTILTWRNFRPNDAEEVSVFCRIRPPNVDNDENCIRVIDDKTVQLTPPESSRAFFTWGFNEKEVQYSFRKVFDIGANQKQVFDEVKKAAPRFQIHVLCTLCFSLIVFGFFKMGQTRPLFSLFSSFQYTVDRKQMFNI